MLQAVCERSGESEARRAESAFIKCHWINAQKNMQTCKHAVRPSSVRRAAWLRQATPNPSENKKNGLNGRPTPRPGSFAFSIIISHSRETRSHSSSLMRVGARAQRRCLRKTPRSNEAIALCRCSENVQLNRFIKIAKVLKLICSTDSAVYV